MTNSSIANPDSTDNLKRCQKCGELKLLDAFSRNKTRRDGLQRECKSCNAAYAAANAERIAERQRTYCAANAERIAEYKREYRAANAEYIAEQKREYYAANAERIAEYWAAKHEQKVEYQREYRAANAESIAERGRTYRQTEAGKAVKRAAGHNRRARKVAAGGTFSVDDLDAIRAAQTDRKGRLICWRCGKPIKDTPHLDHWQPLKHGGPNSAGNLHYMHWKCNLEKAAKLPAELGRLI